MAATTWRQCRITTWALHRVARFQANLIIRYHLLQLRGVAGTAAFADEEFVHRVSDGPNQRRVQLPFAHRAALTIVLVERNYGQAYAVEKESVHAEGALVAPAASNVDALWFPVLKSCVRFQYRDYGGAIAASS